jgi:hypothetical protein
MSAKPDYCVLCDQAVNFSCPTCGNSPFSKYRSQRPFEHYQPQPDTAERVRRQVQAIPFALPEKRDE